MRRSALKLAAAFFSGALAVSGVLIAQAGPASGPPPCAAGAADLHCTAGASDTWASVAAAHRMRGLDAGTNGTDSNMNTAADQLQRANFIALSTSDTAVIGEKAILHIPEVASSPPVSSTTTTTSLPGPTTTVRPTTTSSMSSTTSSTAVPTTTAAPTTTTPSSPTRFATLPPGAVLPSETTCAARVRRMTENRPDNAPFNARRGTSPHNEIPRVTGNFTGTTDEIIQWAACKWGLDEDWARAQAGIESWHRQDNTFGDFGSDPAACLPGHPIGADGRPGECPQSIGLLQVRYPYHGLAFEDNNAIQSTAYNADYTWALWRQCFNGETTWLNDVERGRQYAAGDALGCMGVWFSGRWYTSDAVGYMNRVRDEFYTPRVWTQANFPPARPVTTPPPATTTTTTVPVTTTTVRPTTTTVRPTTTTAPPVTTTTVRPTTTTAPPVTTTTVRPTTTTAPPVTTTTTTPPPAGLLFQATFNTPADFYDRFQIDAHFRDVLAGNGSNVLWGKTFPGDHDMGCGAPTTSRTLHAQQHVDGAPDGAADMRQSELFWWCAPGGDAAKGHMMTGMGDIDGYTILSFSPNQSFQNARRICWDVNLTYLGGRKWPQMIIIPEATYQANGRRIDYIMPGTQDVDGTALRVPAGSFLVQQHDAVIEAYSGQTRVLEDWLSFRTNDKAKRYNHCVTDNRNGTVTIDQERDGGERRVLTVQGSFPANARVIFQDDNYTPDKDQDPPLIGYTWHWDNVVVDYG